jgi:hypothetical protein
MRLPALLSLAAAALLAPPAPAAAQTFEAAPLPDETLRLMTGKFILPNGAEIALTVVSQTAIDNQVVLRSVFRVGEPSAVEVYGRTEDSAGSHVAPTTMTVAPSRPTSVSVAFDRHSGTSTITPSYSAPTTAVQLGGGDNGDPASLGLTRIAAAPGAAPAATIDGSIAVASLPRGTMVTLAGDQFTTSQLVGDAIASVVTNSANDRTIDTVTNVNIDLRDISTFTAGSAALRVDALALDAARGMVR